MLVTIIGVENLNFEHKKNGKILVKVHYLEEIPFLEGFGYRPSCGYVDMNMLKDIYLYDEIDLTIGVCEDCKQ